MRVVPCWISLGNPYLRIEFGYKRTGTVSAIHHGLSFDGCVQACHNHPHRKSIVSARCLTFCLERVRLHWRQLSTL